jgi:hypothetical protein
MQTVHDLAQRQCPNTRRGKLNGQRHAVEALADFGHQRAIVPAHNEIGTHVPGAVGEQLDGLVGKGQ